MLANGSAEDWCDPDDGVRMVAIKDVTFGSKDESGERVKVNKVHPLTLNSVETFAYSDIQRFTDIMFKSLGKTY